MISLYKDNGQPLTTIAIKDIPQQSVQEAKKFILESCIVSFDDAVLVATDGLIREVAQLPRVKFAVLLKAVGDEVDLAPVTFYVRRTDKKGLKLTLSPFTSISELIKLIEDRMSIPSLSQELYFNGRILDEPSDTLKLLDLKSNRIIHIVDRRFIFVDLESPFTIYLQGPNHKSEAVPLEVRGKMSLSEFKHRAAQKMNIPAENIIVAYCSQVMEDNDQNLFGWSLTENAIIKVLDDRSAYIEHFSRKDEEDTFIKRQNKALAHFPPRDPKISPREDIRFANSVMWQEGGNISILNSEAPDKSYMESFRINESVSYEQTYNRAIKATYKKVDSPAKVIDTHFPTTTESVNEIPENTEQSNIAEQLSSSTPIVEFFIHVQDLLGSGQSFSVGISQIDTVKDIKNKLQSIHTELGESFDLLLDGKMLEQEEVAKDLGITADSQITLMPRS